MNSARDDLLELFDFCWQRFGTRTAGLTDDEWQWQPLADYRVTIRWRLDHIAQFLREQRNGPWHLVDELIHHTAEVAILRDLWPGYPAITEG